MGVMLGMGGSLENRKEIVSRCHWDDRGLQIILAISRDKRRTG